MIELLACAVLTWSDGDSGRCDGQRFRLHGVDAAEIAPYTRCRSQPTIWACRAEHRPHAAAATARARSLTRDGATCRIVDTDRYQRVVVTCRVRGGDLGTILVREGLVVADPTYGRHLRSVEAEARRAGRGVWG